MRPISGPVVVKFGQEKVAGLKSNGIEIRGTLGQTVKAADGGLIIYAGSLSNWAEWSYWWITEFRDGVYGNLSSVAVSKGATVTKGQKVGTLGRDSQRRNNQTYTLKYEKEFQW